MKVESKVILPEIQINRILPSNYTAETSYIGVTQEVKLFNFGKAYVDSNAVIFRGFRWMKETVPDAKSSFYQKQKLLVKLCFRTKIKSEKGAIFVAFDSFNVMYYHWLCDLLVRLFFFQKSVGKEFKVALPKSYYQNNFCLASLRMLGIEKDQIIVIDRKEAVKSSEVFFVSSVLGGGLGKTTYDSAIIELRDKVIKYCKSHEKLSFNLGKKIFISRSKQKKRIITNQKEVDCLMHKYGFSIINMEDLSFEDGVSVIYNADCVISQCGSNLTNIMFCKEGAKVLELYPKKEYGDANGGTWFSELSQAFNLRHYYQYCAIDQDNVVINEFHTDMIVDTEELEKNLKLFA